MKCVEKASEEHDISMRVQTWTRRRIQQPRRIGIACYVSTEERGREDSGATLSFCHRELWSEIISSKRSAYLSYLCNNLLGWVGEWVDGWVTLL